MGVQGLWTIASPCARPTNLSTLNRKRLAIDASIWIYQFLKAVRDKEGHALRNSHVVGFFRRICKLLWYGVQPVFVFDGGAPALKRATLLGRRRRREGRREDAARTAGRLLAVQMQRMAEVEGERRRKRAAAVEDGTAAAAEEDEVIPNMDEIVYADELGMTPQERQRTRHFRKQDAYHLPDLQGSIDGMGKPNDPRIMSIEELEAYAQQFHSGEDTINLYDFSKIDFDGDFFRSLPPADRYNILNAARLRSRLRMGLSKDQLDTMFPDRMAFSRFQIERVRERNHLTQRLMAEMGMTGLDLTLGGASRVAGDRNREYILVKNEGAEGGWALGVVSRDKERGMVHKPIDVDALEFRYQGKDEEEEEEDVEFEDVPIEGVNRLPRPKETEESLFVDNGGADLFYDEFEDEEEQLSRAIAMSLEKQHGAQDGDNQDENDRPDEDAPQWEQKAVEAPRPIVSASGRMVAHIVNNRASAAVPRRRSESRDRDMDGNNGDSDSDVDLQAALAAARKKQPKVQPAKPQTLAVAGPSKASTNPFEGFGGPLPFEKLDWKSAFGGRLSRPEPPQPQLNPQKVESADLEAESDDEAGGFEKETEPPETSVQAGNNTPRPLPPWLTDDTDIRESVRKQQELEVQMNEEDEDVGVDGLQFGGEDVIEIESSSEGGESDVEILDAPPLREQEKQLGLGQGLGVMPGASLPVEDGGSAMVEQESAPEPEPEAEAVESDEDMEFEDVLPEPASEPEPQPAPTNDALEAELFGEEAAQTEMEEGIPAPAPEEFDLSDPEEEELLAQLAEEAEEHARFASQLNHKPQLENQEAYERELRALRSQQKKDRRDADEVTQTMVSECQALLTLFGIPYITAPMEAEAQCAELVRLGLVDGIVTDDSDTFLFGGTRVYKNMFNSNKYVECYLARDLETELALPREQLIALAQLLGSDYTEGLPGVGPVTALEILSEFPDDSLTAFRDWWQTLQQHPTQLNNPPNDPSNTPFRRKFRRSHITKLFLPPGFPSPAVTEAYLNPIVDTDPQPFQWGVPDLDGLRRFLMTTVGWSQEHTDEVLVPVIRDVNRRGVEGTQSNITRFFTGGVGVGARDSGETGEGERDVFAPRQRKAGSKRMVEAVGRLRARGGRPRNGLREEMEMPVAVPPGPKRKRKAGRGEKAEDGEDEGDGENEEEEEEVVVSRNKGTGARRGKGKKAKA
ncbi:uncharacterized protein C8A04DRAFT_15572 [Dichotomopilus funicola]|uniref:Uncharacterized protein n=1 Tax=Dichotomopilus funicola TaxID=1934379 RepID=A0AAN6UVE8_9PEZI|nr:hypothetical protein C8A04DRAFT_15572 [Dichotomopilus funicola]